MTAVFTIDSMIDLPMMAVPRMSRPLRSMRSSTSSVSACTVARSGFSPSTRMCISVKSGGMPRYAMPSGVTAPSVKPVISGLGYCGLCMVPVTTNSLVESSGSSMTMVSPICAPR